MHINSFSSYTFSVPASLLSMDEWVKPLLPTRSYVLDFDFKSVLLHQITQLAQEASVENWNGDGGLPVSPSTLETAEAFMKLLLWDCIESGELIDVSVDNLGFFYLEIYQSIDQKVLISLMPNGEIAFAAWQGTTRTKGYLTIQNFSESSTLRQIIADICGSLRK